MQLQSCQKPCGCLGTAAAPQELLSPGPPQPGTPAGKLQRGYPRTEHRSDGPAPLGLALAARAASSPRGTRGKGRQQGGCWASLEDAPSFTKPGSSWVLASWVGHLEQHQPLSSSVGHHLSAPLPPYSPATAP